MTTVETKVETAASAKARGFRYVRSDGVAVVPVTGEPEQPSLPCLIASLAKTWG